MRTEKAQPPMFVRAGADANPLLRFGARLGGLFCAICVLLPSPAEAQCKQWNASGKWQLKQEDLVVRVDLRQDGKNKISGTAKYTNNRKQTLNGGVEGSLYGEILTLNMDWDDGSGGNYKGVVGATGMIKGDVAIDKNHPKIRVAWHSMQPLKCADTEAKEKPSNSTAPAAPAQPPGREDPILAAKPLLVIPPAGRDYGHSHLSWDAGIRHSNAELWLKVDNGSWTVAAKQAKDSYRPFKIERGKTYVFSLRDGSGELRSVTVKCQPSAGDTAAADAASDSSGSREPFLRASRESVRPSPGQDYGWTQLSWDSGGANRRAQLSVEVDGGEVKAVSNEPKGSAKPFRIESGKTYVFTLTVQRQEVGSVTVRGE